MMRRSLLVVCLLSSVLGCVKESDPIDAEGKRIFRIGYMPNLTHAPALVGLEAAIFEEALGPEVRLKARAFTAGPSVVEAIFAGELDVAYVGPNPAINAYVRTKGEAVRIIAGSTSGGAALVVQRGIGTPAELLQLPVSSPAIANTQDIAFRTWIHEHGYRTRDEGGTVELIPLAPFDSFSLFKRGRLAGAWLPEPWVSRMILEADGVVLVQERSLWPGGEFPTAVVIATTAAIRSRPALLRAFLEGHREAIGVLREDPVGSRRRIEGFLRETANLDLPPEVVERALGELRFSDDPLAQQMQTLARRASALGYLEPGVAVEPILDLRFLRRSKVND